MAVAVLFSYLLSSWLLFRFEMHLVCVAALTKPANVVESSFFKYWVWLKNAKAQSDNKNKSNLTGPASLSNYEKIVELNLLEFWMHGLHLCFARRDE